MYKTKMNCSHIFLNVFKKNPDVKLPKYPQFKIKYQTKNELIEGSKMNISFIFINKWGKNKIIEDDVFIIRHAK